MIYELVQLQPGARVWGSEQLNLAWGVFLPWGPLGAPLGSGTQWCRDLSFCCLGMSDGGRDWQAWANRDDIFQLADIFNANSRSHQ